MNNLILSSLFLFITLFSSAQKIENIRTEQQEKKIIIYYALTGTKTGQTFNVKVYCSTDGGANWGEPLHSVTGDVGKNVTTGYNKKIVWDVLKDREKLQGDKIQFEIRAKVTGGAMPDMVFVQGGTYQMGSNDGGSDEKPVHTVTVSSFNISKYEITNAQYCKFLNEKGNQKEGGAKWLDIKDNDCRIYKSGGTYYPENGYKKHPVVEVTWYGAKAYCQWAGGRLPTEAEWEYAARGGVKTIHESSQTKYAGSNNINDVAWFTKNSGNKTNPVGTKQPNELGIYDMSGNVWEWCSDWYDKDYYKNSPENNPKGASSNSYRVLRGGSWLNNANNCRSAYRNGIDPVNSYDYLGFRICLSVLK